jgi:tetratricopeptide (TPR) repeat protein
MSNSSEDEAELAARRFRLGASLHAEHRLAEAASVLTDAIDRWRAIATSTPSVFGRRNLLASLHMLAIVRADEGALMPANVLMTEVVKGLRDVFADTPLPAIRRELGGALRENGMLLHRLGEHDTAIQVLSEATEHARAFYKEDTSVAYVRELTRCLHELALCQAVRDSKQAARTFEQATIHARLALAAEGATVLDRHYLAKALHGMGLAHMTLAEYGLAIPALEEAVSHLEALYQSTPSNDSRQHLAASLQALARAKQLAEQPQESLLLLRRAVSILREMSQDEQSGVRRRPNLIHCLFDLATLEHSMGQYAEAIVALREAVAFDEAQQRDLGINLMSSTGLRAAVLLGSALGAAGNYAAAESVALAAVTQARELERTSSATSHRDTLITALRLLALCRKSQGRLDQAHDLENEARLLQQLERES